MSLNATSGSRVTRSGLGRWVIAPNMTLGCSPNRACWPPVEESWRHATIELRRNVSHGLVRRTRCKVLLCGFSSLGESKPFGPGNGGRSGKRGGPAFYGLERSDLEGKRGGGIKEARSSGCGRRKTRILYMEKADGSPTQYQRQQENSFFWSQENGKKSKAGLGKKSLQGLEGRRPLTFFGKKKK